MLAVATVALTVPTVTRIEDGVTIARQMARLLAKCQNKEHLKIIKTLFN